MQRPEAPRREIQLESPNNRRSSSTVETPQTGDKNIAENRVGPIFILWATPTPPVARRRDRSETTIVIPNSDPTGTCNIIRASDLCGPQAENNNSTGSEAPVECLTQEAIARKIAELWKNESPEVKEEYRRREEARNNIMGYDPEAVGLAEFEEECGLGWMAQRDAEKGGGF